MHVEWGLLIVVYLFLQGWRATLIPLLAVGLGVSTKLLQSSDEQMAEMIQTLVDELAPQLGLVPATDEEKAAVRNQVVQKIHAALPQLLASKVQGRHVTSRRRVRQLRFDDVEPVQGLGLGGLDHERLLDDEREVHRRRVEALL